jgi:hypothetical protein
MKSQINQMVPDSKEEKRNKLVFNLQSMAMHNENFEKDCTETKRYVDSLVDFSLIQWNTGHKLKWQFGNNLYVKQTKSIHLGKSLEKSYYQIPFLKKKESFKNTNKKWQKLNKEEKAMLKKMTVNNYSKELNFNDEET